MKKYCLLIILIAFVVTSNAQKAKKPIFVLPAAYQTNEYLPMLKGKRVGVFANHTATIGNTHLVDSLQKLGIKITKAFGPEHGFRGQADAGEKIDNYIDAATGIPVISLYGKKKNLQPKTLKMLM